MYFIHCTVFLLDCQNTVFSGTKHITQWLSLNAVYEGQDDVLGFFHPY